MTTYTDVDFGRFDAEADTNLLGYFLKTGQANEASTGAQLIIGRKGAGKTALFRHLEHTLPVRVVSLDLEGYVFEFHRGFRAAGFNDGAAYGASWKLLIYSAMYATLRDSMPKDLRELGDAALEVMGQGDNASVVRRMWDWLGRVRRVDLPSLEGLASLGGLELADAPAPSPLTTATTTALRQLETVVSEQVQKVPCTVLIDRLDDAWSSSDDSAALIGGALRATREISLKLPRRPGAPAPVITFLRSDIHESLAYNDKNKMSQDTVHLDWSTSALINVVQLRIQASLGEDADWNSAFTNTPMRQKASTQTYMLKRCLGRPRDLIAFATFAQQAARANDSTQVIETDDVYLAENRHSRHVLDELADEIGTHVANYAAVISSLKALRKRTFDVNRWQTVCRDNGLDSAEATTALKQLFEASAVGTHRAGGSTGGSTTIYRYQDRHLTSMPSANHQVHLALVKELGLTDA